MNKVNIIFVAFLLLTGCGGGIEGDGFITVDVTKSYPQKDLIIQDFMEVEYIALETGGEFYCQGNVQAIGKDIIIVINRVRDGDIFIFDRKTGKGIRRINRQGQGPEEYVRISGVARIILDEDNGEMFVTSTAGKILVYDLHGNFKRSFMSSLYDVFEYDKDNLIGYDVSDFFKRGEDREKAYHVLISKQDGNITREIFIPFETIHTPVVIRGGWAGSPGELSQIIPHQGKWIFADTSSDTLYTYSPENILTPFLVRTPSIHVMNPPEVYLSIMALTDSYYFMNTMENDFDFETGKGFTQNTLMYDKNENALFKYAIYNDDYTEKRQLSSIWWRPYNHEIAARVILEADQLVEDYEKGILKGKLKEIAAELNEEDNPVIMLIKHKK